jgi:hypothetical protein
MMKPTVLLPVELSPAGIADARLTLDQLKALVDTAQVGRAGGETETVPAAPAAAGGQQPDVVTIYEHARTVPDSRTPSLLELFAREDPLTPEEIGIALGNRKPLTKAQGRAIVRNLSRMQGHLIKQGRIAGPVLVKDFTGYEQEGAGRYGLSDEDRAALRTHLKP